MAEPTTTSSFLTEALPRGRPELLAPAGDWECARAAVENGADAIYFGLERFNARMRAKNFTQADLPALMTFLHRRGVKGYVTFNTLVFADELIDARDYLRGIIAAGVDAAIVQDVGICRLIRSLSPNFPIHCSTQMTITSAEGVQFAEDLDTQLVVLARENSIADISAIRRELSESKSRLQNQKDNCLDPESGAVDVDPADSLPLEVFVHGALCVAYSGQCLTSESLGGRSANRGECAQACRLPYDLISDGVQVPLGDRRYLLSPQDLSGLDVLPELVAAGVSSLKIEGRLKSPEYVASITRVYRQALDKTSPLAFSIAEGPNHPVLKAEPGKLSAARTPAPAGKSSLDSSSQSPSARYELEMSFSRGLYTGWFRGIDNQKLAHARFGTKRGVFLGEILAVEKESVCLRLSAPLKPGDGVVFDAGKPDEREEGGRVYQVEIAFEKSGGGQTAVLRFGRGDINWQRVRVGQRLWKTNDPALDREVRTTFEGTQIRFQRPVSMEVHGRSGCPLTLVVKDEEGHSVQIQSEINLSIAEKHPLTNETLRDQLGRLGGTPFRLGELTSFLEGVVMLPVSELNRMRREAAEQLDALRAAPKRWVLNSRLSPLTVADVQTPLSPETAPELIVVIRLLEQLKAAWNAGARTIYCEFENPKLYRDAVTKFRELQDAEKSLSEPKFPSSIWVAPPRIFLPGEGWILQQVRSSNADGYLVRNHAHLSFFARDRKRGDFSLNVANGLTAEYLLNRYGLERVTTSYDLNIAQLESLLKTSPASWYEITIHQRMPMFHMNHCVFCAFLSSGKDYRDCGRPCDRHNVSLRDRVGAELPLKADAGCRNTVFNNRAQSGAEYASKLIELGARYFRVEFINEPAGDVSRTLLQYQRLLRGEISGDTVWRELKLLNQLGVTRGQIEAPPQVIHRKT